MNLTKFVEALGQVGGAMMGFDWRRYLLLMVSIAALTALLVAIGATAELAFMQATGAALLAAVGLTGVDGLTAAAPPKTPRVPPDSQA